MKVLPVDIPALIEELEKLYPPRCMRPNEAPADHLFYAGKVELISHLRERLVATEKLATKRALERT